MSSEEKVEFYKKQIELEQKIIKVAKESAEDLKNALIKELILAIAIDSEKHISMLNALITLNTEVTPFIPEEQAMKLAEVIQKHIELEAITVETYKELLDKIEHEKERIVIRAIYQDELRHHALLHRINKVIVDKETIKEDEMWAFLWEDAIPQF
ncbi:MAG: ferritin-like domain-containing protein [Candidatus Heimdallarchaeaceae archaeon]